MNRPGHGRIRTHYRPRLAVVVIGGLTLLGNNANTLFTDTSSKLTTGTSSALRNLNKRLIC